MKKLYLLILLACIQQLNAQIIDFPDPNLKARLLQSSATNSIAQNSSFNNVKIDVNNDSEIEISEALIIASLDISGSGITSMDGLNAFSNLKELYANNNQFQIADISQLGQLYLFSVGNNPNLEILNIKNGIMGFPATKTTLTPPPLIGASFANCPNLAYICLGDQFINALLQYMTTYGITNQLNYNSYCSFNPGGDYYTIEGIARFDAAGDGCDEGDLFASNLRYNVTNGTNTADFLTNTGSYFIPVSAGAYTITPLLDYPSYFNITPSSITVNFPGDESPVIQNFCITSGATAYNDLELVLFQLNTARPGFNANYRIVYRNKGNQTLSGTVNLNFNDAVLDFVSSNPLLSDLIPNNLKWNFTNLKPFEARQIDFTLNVNSPTETPPVNSGDILSYTASISNVNDATPNNNSSILNQTVFNSFDPNDKICLEGTTVSASKIGEYVHYRIRFENTGTFAAENVVIKDMIDTTQLDVNSLITLGASHTFSTRIFENNRVEFIFENINLPFDDAHNDGYIIFKIRTKTSLNPGDTFSNTAAIYFDYNFPIATNTAATTIDALSDQDFEFGNYFTLAPNPVKDILNIQAKNEVAISSITIYTILGQQVLTVTHPDAAIHVESLRSGNYFIKIISDKGTSNTRFIKE